MISKINQLLFPLENIIKKHKKWIGYFLLILTLASFMHLASTHGVKESGEQAILVLWIILWLPILARVCDIGIAKALMPLRKELGILMGTLAVIHAIAFIAPNQDFFMSKGFWISGSGYPTAYTWGYIAYLLTIPLLLTSNNWAIRKLGKKWKTLHKLVYVIVIFTVVHVVALKFARHFEVGPVIILILYFIGKTLEWKGVKLTKTPEKYPRGQRWICPPCGFIYDPKLGDTDSGIEPGTEFVDIPDDWSCPECGVKKSDFIPYDASVEQAKYEAIVDTVTMLNPTTLELIVTLKKHFVSKAGQFMTFLFEDADGVFPRQYSIVEQKGDTYTFTIKLTELGRGARYLRELSRDESIDVAGVYGSFGLQDTESQKIFVASGTGLAPLYNMIVSLPKDIKKSLYFSVSTEAELFYIEKLGKIAHLDLHIHVTRETVAGYETGRVDVSTIEATPDTEWYFCGNPQMVSDGKKKLSDRGFTQVYSEEFN